MNAFWRGMLGPLVTLGAACLYMFVPALRDAPPAPGALLLACILLATVLGGTVSGLVSALIGIACGAYALSDPGQFLVMQREGLFRLCLLIGFGFGVPTLVANIRARSERQLACEKAARAKVEAAHRELMLLHAALDKVDHGVLVLDEDLHVDFMNDAFRRIWALDTGVAERRPSFAELVQCAASKGVRAAHVLADDDYVAHRIALVRRGCDDPIDLRLASGDIVRFQCKILPTGGRLLTYTDVTDLVHQSEEFERLATTDDLTGVFNRRHFMALAERAFGAARTDGGPLALLILDIDLFKSINDCFGHGVGDAVICHVADVCRDAQRPGDILARIGGEEFTLLLPDTNLDNATTLAETIRNKLLVSPVVIEGHDLHTTVSIGIATADGATLSLGEMMRRADQALYGAKRSGRNRVQSSLREPARRAPAAPPAAA